MQFLIYSKDCIGLFLKLRKICLAARPLLLKFKRFAQSKADFLKITYHLSYTEAMPEIVEGVVPVVDLD